MKLFAGVLFLALVWTWALWPVTEQRPVQFTGCQCPRPLTEHEQRELARAEVRARVQAQFPAGGPGD